MDPKFTHDVFLSHSSKDKPVVREIAERLHTDGLRVWLDEWVLKPGDSIPAKIEEGLEHSRVLVLCMSANAFGSDWAQLESGTFRVADPLNKERRFIPLRLDDEPIKGSLAQFLYIHWRSADREKEYAKLLEACRPSQRERLANSESQSGAKMERKGIKQTGEGCVVHQPRRFDILQLPSTDYTLFGRTNILKKLDAAWVNRNLNVVAIVAFGGTGKTALVNHWLQNLQDQGWHGAESVFTWSFSNQESSDFMSAALNFFGVADAGQVNAEERGRLLAAATRQQRTLLILDGVEALQEPPGGPRAGYIRDEGLCSLLRDLANENDGMCVVTTRTAIEDLPAFRSRKWLSLSLKQLDIKSGVKFLRHLKVTGPTEELERATREYGRHALALRLLGNFLHVAYGGDIQQRDKIGRLADEEKDGHEAIRVMHSYEQWFSNKPELSILFAISLFGRRAEKGAIAELRQKPLIRGLTEMMALNDVQWNYALSRLHAVGLLSDIGDDVECHPLVGEYFAERFRKLQPIGWQKAHGRLYEYFRQKPQNILPVGREEMEPLFQAVTHGWLAGDRFRLQAFREVYWERISRGDEAYCTHRLGAVEADLGAIRKFFSEPWKTISEVFTATERAWLFNQAGYDLRAVGRLLESLEPIKAGLDLGLDSRDWRSAARCANNAARVSLMLGKIVEALEFGQRAVAYAEKSGDLFRVAAYQSNLAHTLHQAGRFEEAGNIFVKVEEWYKQSSEQKVRTNQYCDFLLTQGNYVEACRRARISLADEGDRPLNVALDRLSLARALMGQWLQEREYSATRKLGLQSKEISMQLEKCMSLLKTAGRLHEIPRGLLGYAEYHRMQGDLAVARKYLDEADDLASRCGMKLHLIEIHLERARLAVDERNLPKARKQYEMVRNLSEETGYRRIESDLIELKKLL